MNLDAIRLAEEIHGESILPRDVDGGEEAAECAMCGRTDGLTIAGGRPFCQRHARGDR